MSPLLVTGEGAGVTLSSSDLENMEVEVVPMCLPTLELVVVAEVTLSEVVVVVVAVTMSLPVFKLETWVGLVVTVLSSLEIGVTGGVIFSFTKGKG